MTMTILPGQADGTTPPPSHRQRPGSRRTVIVAAVAAVVVLAGVGWFLTRSGGSNGTTPPVAAGHPAAAAGAVAHHLRIPAHGRVSNATLTATATPVFSAMNSSLGGWAGRVQTHVKYQRHPDASDRELDRCAGVPFRPSTQVTSNDFVRTPYRASGEVDLYASATAARADFATAFRPAARSCMRTFFTKELGGANAAAALTSSSFAIARVRGMRDTGRIRVVAGYVVNGRQLAVEVDAVASVVGRTVVTFVEMGFQQQPDRPQELGTLRAMVAALRPTLA